jgi:hypothetical protein
MNRRHKPRNNKTQPVPAKSISLFFPARQLVSAKGGKPRTFTFRPTSEVAEFVDSMMAEGYTQADALNHIGMFVRTVVTEAKPHDVLLVAEAEQYEGLVSMAVARLVIERLQEKHPEMAKHLANLKKK